MWSMLMLTLPTRPNAVRLRIWRALKALGCAALRDGVYLLPAAHGALFEPLATEVREHGGTAMMLRLSPQDDAQRGELLALFDRGQAYAQWVARASALQTECTTLTLVEAHRQLRSVAESLDELTRVDYYPGAAAAQAQSTLRALRQTLGTCFAKGEPQALRGHDIARLDRRKFQGRRWATRSRPWVDRLACAWLIRRFIDPQAHFLWLADPAGTTPAPRGALGFDYDGARFTHVGAHVSFEVLLASFGLEGDARLQRLAATVRYLDAGGIPTAEAAGLHSVLAGQRELFADDDRLACAAGTTFDALYAAPGSQGVPS